MRNPLSIQSKRTRNALCVLGAVFTLCTYAGCGGDSGLGIGPPSSGQLGQSNVSPECGALNQACLSTGLNSPVATGSKLGIGVDFKISGSSGPPAGLSTTRPEVMTTADGVLDAIAPGISGVLITDPDNRVVDFIHVWVADASELRILRYNDAGVVYGAVRDEGTVVVGDEILISIEAFADSQPLLGLFKIDWTLEVLETDPDGTGEPIVVVPDIVFGLYRILVREPGLVRLTASALGVDKTITLEVLP